MKREEFIESMDRYLKLVRTEYGLTQEKMSVCLGISKKTLVEIEKERGSLGWTGAVTAILRRKSSTGDSPSCGLLLVWQNFISRSIEHFAIEASITC